MRSAGRPWRAAAATDSGGVPRGAGIVAVTADGPADQAGLRPGDVIRSLGKKPATDAEGEQMRGDAQRFEQPPILPATAAGPRRRALLEARWQARLREVIELSVAYHEAASAPAAGGENRDAQVRGEQQRLLDRAVAARRALADTEQALDRLSAGSYGRCEQCAAEIPEHHLAVTPEARYCPRCAPADNDRRLPSPPGGKGGDPARRAHGEPVPAGTPPGGGPARPAGLVR
jgi:RNA polymerase-binding transcription factor DksA